MRRLQVFLARFGIPSLTAYQGRAIYLDADMLVFNDIYDLWSMPMGDAKLLLQAEPSVDELNYNQNQRFNMQFC